mmetsp:Transcript_18365/g.27887  ORF Transcript_18365/g.27887 Transcript_18365/m.27887 type:complete len:660 (+) Transcript_18365:264-2243(+)
MREAPISQTERRRRIRSRNSRRAMATSSIALHLAVVCSCTYTSSIVLAFSPSSSSMRHALSLNIYDNDYSQHTQNSRSPYTSTFHRTGNGEHIIPTSQIRQRIKPLHLIKPSQSSRAQSNSPQTKNTKTSSNNDHGFRFVPKNFFKTIKENNTAPTITTSALKNSATINKSASNANSNPKKNFMGMDMDMDMDMPKEMWDEMMAERTDFEMSVMSTLAITVPIGIIATLAMTGEETAFMSSTEAFIRDLLSLSATADTTLLTEDGIDLIEDGIETLEAMSINVYEAAMPTSAVDVISVALGEGIAASIGACVSFILSSTAKTKGLIKKAFNGDAISSEAEARAGENLVSSAIADTDYFLTRAAAMPLLGAVGLPSFLGVFVATIPSQLVKLSARQKEQRQREEFYMDVLLKEERIRAEQNKNPFANMFKGEQQLKKEEEERQQLRGAAINGDSSAIPMPILSDMNVTPGAANQIDFVEIFGDITKWLEYEVLANELGGTFVFNGMAVPSGIESGVFGFLASLSSLLYSDIIYRYFDAGLDVNREAARARGARDTAVLYLVRCFSAATLFGVYETVRQPISRLIVNFLSGGVDSCLGSADYDLCLETFFIVNTPDASFEGEMRAFAVSAMNLLERLSEAPIGSEEFTRSVIVQIYSTMHI